MEQTVIFIFGAVGYPAVEILWRGHTHWTMSLVGGVCAVCLYEFFVTFPEMSVWLKSLAGALIITGVEFAAGMLVNVKLGWNVWDYSKRAFNVCGQICPLYSALWFFMCVPVVKLFEYFRSRMFL